MTTDSAGQSWSPPTSAYQTKRQHRFTESRLSLAGRRLTWSPVSVAPSSAASKAFDVALGTAPGQAAELVWLCGSVALSRVPGPQVNLVAVCAQQAVADRGKPREVLGYLPIGLFAPFNGLTYDGWNSREPTEQRIREVAQACGLAYSAYTVDLGSDVNATFPGALPHAGFIRAVGWFQAFVYIVFAVFWIGLSSSVHNLAGRAGLDVVGVFFLLMGVLMLPPVTHAISRRRARRRHGLA